MYSNENTKNMEKKINIQAYDFEMIMVLSFDHIITENDSLKGCFNKTTNFFHMLFMQRIVFKIKRKFKQLQQK